MSRISPGLPHVVGAEHPGARARRETAVAASVPTSRSPTGRSSVSPTKSLLDNETSTGQPVATSSPSRRVASSECQVFLPKSWPGSIRTGPGARRAATARSASGGRTVRRCRPPRRRTPPGAAGSAAASPPAWVHTSAAPNSAATSASPGSTPPQASLSRSAPASQQPRADLVPPGVDADHQVGVRGRTAATNADGPPDLLGRVDLVAGPGLHPADVDDVGALVDGPVAPRSSAAAVVERRALVVERVRACG